MPYRLFNLDEVAKYLHLTPEDVTKRVKDGVIPFEKRGERFVFRKSDIDLWASRRILALPEPRLADYHQKFRQSHPEISADEAILSELLTRGAIDSAMTAKTKASLLRDIVDLADKTKQVCSPRELVESLVQRESLGSTAVPGGLALLHPRVHEPYMFTASFLVVGRSMQEIHFGAPDGHPTTLFVLLCCQDDRSHLHTLARLCLMALTTEMLAQLRQAPDAKSMLDCLLAAEQAVLSRAKSKRRD
ncbi:MAG TPA: PTS sugar transporter subunit IIA [Verrucomicrobiae bacterium]|nr:PTS sugar transporter subunit IIA [Verrucomicrobiae bacterium]